MEIDWDNKNMLKESISNLFYQLCRFFFVYLLFLSAVQAFELRPMAATLLVSEGQLTQKFVVSNSGDKPIAVEMSAHQRILLENGAERLELDEDNILLFPNQLILKPGTQRTVKLQWLGELPENNELAYRVVAEQLPIELEKKTAGIHLNILKKYLASLYIKPKNTTPKLKLYDLNIAPELLNVTIKNEGSAHIVPLNAKLDLLDSEGEHLAYLPVKELGSVNFLPGLQKQFEFKLGSEFAVGDISNVKLVIDGP